VDDQIAEVGRILGAFWDERSIEASQVPESMDQLYAPLDSMTAVEVLIDLEPVVDRELPVDFMIRKGGYNTREQFIEEVTSRVTEFIKANPL
jgi:hypothetical protein